jgi:TrmH family RNA methyltransferase
LSDAPEFYQGLPLIRSRKNDRLRLVRALVTRRGRRQRQRFLVEGPKALSEVLEQRPDLLEQLLYRAAAPSLAVARVLEQARAAGVSTYPVESSVFDELAPSQTPQGVLAVAHLAYAPLDDVLGSGEEARAVVACLGVQDPGNLGTILRSARFFACAGVVVLPGTQDPFSPKVVRSAAGTLLAQPPARAEDLESLLRAATTAGFEPRALAAHGGEPLAKAGLPKRCLLLLGAEGQGLPADTDPLPALTIATPVSEAESLNVGVAFAVAAHTWCAEWGGA